jgi:hypothetical protein
VLRERIGRGRGDDRPEQVPRGPNTARGGEVVRVVVRSRARQKQA